MMQIYNSLSKEKEEFKPIQPGKVSLYVCGMTVYDFCHIGHARGMVVFDVVANYFRHCGFTVNYVRNITDIDDKIIARANENNESIAALTARVIATINEDAQKLGVRPPTAEPRATEFIPQMLTMIEQLMVKGYAYQGEQGDVYYAVNKFPAYGALAHKELESLQAGIRVAVTDDKRDPLDFVLWKQAKPGEPSWSSPWGDGRPGWHIECSAMSTHCLGEHFDIHGGGFDLKFPHHENEIAQAQAATGKEFVNYWMHVGFVTVDKVKMSKSLGNFFTIREVLEKYHPEVVRFFMLSSHYRSPVNYSQESLTIARGALERFYTALRDLEPAQPLVASEHQQRFEQAMDDDFNTPEAIAVLFEMTHEINRLKTDDLATASQIGATLRQLAEILGILRYSPQEFLQGALDHEQGFAEKVVELIAKRNQARAEKDWATADQVRDQLAELKVVLEDGPQGTSWRKL